MMDDDIYLLLYYIDAHGTAMRWGEDDTGPRQDGVD
jgi:hypothetical protein